jgi:Ca2+-dependent lipid-binding protein
MADTHHNHHGPRGESMGELQVTVIAGRNLRSDGKSEVAYCTIDLPGNKTARTGTSKNKEPVWNESFNFDLMSLDNDEVLIQVFGKRRISTDKFLGQIQLPIKGLNLSKEISWHYLTDKPKSVHELPDHMRIDPTLSLPRKRTLTNSPSTPKIKERMKSPKDDKKKSKEEKEDKTYITGEISVRVCHLPLFYFYN